MKKKIGAILTEHFSPENPKFSSPLILVHGPWSGSWCWQEWADRFCNLGWHCWAVNYRGRAEEKVLESLARLTFDDCLADLKQVIHAAGSSPVLLGHSLGGLAAVKAAEGERISAVILLSAPVPGSDVKEWTHGLRLLRLKYLPLIFLRQPIRIKEKDFTYHWLASVPEHRRASILKGLVMESGYLVKELFRPSVSLDPKEIRCPVLALGGAEDRVVPVASARHMARALGAEFIEYPGHGHWRRRGGRQLLTTFTAGSSRDWANMSSLPRAPKRDKLWERACEGTLSKDRSFLLKTESYNLILGSGRVNGF